MRKKMYIFLLFLLIISADIVFGNGSNNTKTLKVSHAKHNTKTVTKLAGDRMKRSLSEGEDKWTQRGKRQSGARRDEASWGHRGRQDSAAEYSDGEYATQPATQHFTKYCKGCAPSDYDVRYPKDRREEQPFRGNPGLEGSEELPFWGNRGRRASDESEEPFWGNRGRRQDNQDEPFWGNRGRRQDDSPFWANRGRRDSDPFSGTRGGREEEPFWGNRGRREDTLFWANRGRRDKIEPFWGSRGRRQESEPFWGTRGRREDEGPFWGNRGRRKEDLKESILTAINDVEGDIENLSRLRRSNTQPSFWVNRARDSKLKNIFNDPSRIRLQHYSRSMKNSGYSENTQEPGTVYDNTIYAEEPHYIIVDRSSRSSAEDDPYFISRGKKYYLDLKAARDRRGAIEEIVKSVRNDPYYIARGKKDSDNGKNGNGNAGREDLAKAKDLICSTIELILVKNEANKSKREISDNDRERRTILKKLAAQLQMDPYFVSRGKRDAAALGDFVRDVAARCN